MNAEIERRLRDALAVPVEGASREPQHSAVLPDCTRGPERDFEVESGRLFRRAWIPIARRTEFKEPGDYRTAEVAGDSLVAIHGDDLGVRVFHNVCRHRGAVMMRTSIGCAERLVCPFHGFVYAKNGELETVPDRGSFGSQLDGLKLNAVRSEVAYGWLWVALDDDAPNLSDFLGARLREDFVNWPLGELHLHHEFSCEVEFDWKIGVEAFLESLHLPNIHARTAHPLADYRTTAFDHFDPHSMMATGFRARNAYEEEGPLGAEASRAGAPVFPQLNELQRTSNLSYLIFPSTILSFLPNHLTTFQLLPLGPGRARFSWNLLGAEAHTEAARDYFDSLRAGYEKLAAEDLENLPWIQRGIRDSSYRAPILSHHELRIRAFREVIRKESDSGTKP